MDISAYRRRNMVRRVANRIKHPPPLYKKVGGISAVVTRADGSKEDLGRISATYSKRWGTGTGA